MFFTAPPTVWSSLAICAFTTYTPFCNEIVTVTLIASGNNSYPAGAVVSVITKVRVPGPVIPILPVNTSPNSFVVKFS